MKLLLIVTVLTFAFHATLAIRVRDSASGRFARNTSFSIENRIIGGEDAEEAFAPYHVSLQTLIGSHFCSGAIIAPQWILTAGHCVMGWDPARILVSTGTNDIWTPKAYYYPDKIYIHCNYDNPLYHNDIALVHLETPVEYDTKTQPIDIADELLPKGSKTVLTGWGKATMPGDISQLLQKTEVDYVPYESCKQLYSNDNGVDVGHICTLSSEEKGVCHGDSGAPVVSDGKLVGIVNWGKPCAKGYPDVHASVYFYNDWIRTTMKGCYYNFD